MTVVAVATTQTNSTRSPAGLKPGLRRATLTAVAGEGFDSGLAVSTIPARNSPQLMVKATL